LGCPLIAGNVKADPKVTAVFDPLWFCPTLIGDALE